MEPLPADPDLLGLRTVESSVVDSYSEGSLEYFLEEQPCDPLIFGAPAGFNSPGAPSILESLDPRTPFPTIFNATFDLGNGAALSITTPIQHGAAPSGTSTTTTPTLDEWTSLEPFPYAFCFESIDDTTIGCFLCCGGRSLVVKKCSCVERCYRVFYYGKSPRDASR
jgi:hypothetical protein